MKKANLPLFEITRVLVRLDHVARFMVNAITASCDRLSCIAYPIALLAALGHTTTDRTAAHGNQIDGAPIYAVLCAAAIRLNDPNNRL